MAIIQSIPISGSGGSGSTYYTNMTTDEAITGTNTEERVISAKVLNDAIGNKIPTVNNATLTIQKNGTTVKTFTANSSKNVTCNIEIPTKVSDLTNDSGFIADVSGKADKATTLSGYGITDAYTKTQVDKKVSDLVNSVPETLDTLNELASALGDDPNFATTVANQIGTKANDSDVVHKSGDETVEGVKTFSSKIVGNLQGNADTSTKATQDSAGQQIDKTYIKELSVSGRTITYKRGDNTTGTITTQDTNTWTAFKGATSSANGTAGYVPAPTKGNQDKFFKADGTWATPTNTTYSVATTSANGLMSSTDKTKLDGLSNYTLPTASSTLGGVKTTSTVTSTSGLTACPIISGVVYYKDTNTDTKVTNTLGNTTKAYITGTTSAKTNTGTQIFDSGVYLTTTAGQLHADIDFPITEAQVNEILGIA